MAIRLAYASMSETDSINGVKGDQTGSEVKVNNWYKDSWYMMFIHPDENVREKHAKAAEAAANNQNIGYGQSDRNTLYQEAVKVGMDFSKITNPCNCDCSSFQNACVVASGAPGASYGANGWTVTTMKATLPTIGFKTLSNMTYLNSADYAVRGAIIITPGHTACMLDNGPKYQDTLKAAGLTSTESSGSEDVTIVSDIAIGDEVEFTGSKHYPSASSISGKVCQPGRATVTSIVKGKAHPYHLIAVKPGDSTVFGWVNEEDVESVFVAYKVRITVKDLNIRTGPGTNYDVDGLCPVGAYTIVAESNGVGATKWGKLKSGAGWISLDYAEKI